MSLLKAWTLRGPPVAPAAEFRPLPSRLDHWLRRSQPRLPTIFRRDLSTDALAPADGAEVPLRRAALRPPRRWRAASLRRAAGPFGPAALVAAVLAGGTVLTDPAPDANASLAPVPGPATGGKAFEGGAVGVASLATPLPPLPAPLSPGPETTASLAAPADPVAAGPRSDVGTAGSLVSAFAAVEGGPVRLARLEPDPTAGVPWRRPGPRGDVPGVAATKLLPFESAPFPYHGAMPGSGSAFLNTGRGERRGHRSRRGRILWEQETFSDNRVLVHVPKGFDAGRPGVIVVFFHGHGATLRRDVLERQQVPAQISASGANAVLLAPQFAVDAPDSSAGRFWEQGGSPASSTKAPSSWPACPATRRRRRSSPACRS